MFREFVGEDRFRKFVRSVNVACQAKGRLLFWQQDLWEQFVAVNPNARLTDAEIMAIFRVCFVHDCLLVPSPISELPEKIRSTPESDLAFDTLFPFWTSAGFICPRCREAREEWVLEHLEECSFLRQRTTLEDFCRRQFGALAESPEFIKKARTKFQIITLDMQPGDEIWEWDAGGWHRLAGDAGLAVVRNGKIVCYGSFLRS